MYLSHYLVLYSFSRQLNGTVKQPQFWFWEKKGIYSIFENSGVTFRGGIKYLNQVNYSAQSPRIILASEQNWIDKDTKSIISNFKNVVAPSEGAHSISQMDVPHTHWLLNAPATWKSHSHSILKESVHSRSNKQLKSNISMLFDGDKIDLQLKHDRSIKSPYEGDELHNYLIWSLSLAAIQKETRRNKV